MAKRKNVSISNTCHKRHAKRNALKANAAKTGAENAFFKSKVEYHNKIVRLQSERGKILPEGERSSWYFYFMRRNGVPKDFHAKK